MQKKHWGKQPLQNLVREPKHARELDQHTKELDIYIIAKELDNCM